MMNQQVMEIELSEMKVCEERAAGRQQFRLEALHTSLM